MAPDKKLSSQEALDEFWKTFTVSSNPPAKASAILPRNIYAQKVERLVPKGLTETACVTKSYEEAKKACQAKVAQITRNCRQINQKYNDPYFDLADRLNSIQPLAVVPDSTDGSNSGSDPTAVYDLMQDNVNSGRLALYGVDQQQSGSDGPVPPSVKRVGDIFDNPSFYVEGVNAKDIRQGGDGDCWFLSTLAAMCSMEPAQSLIERVCVARDVEVGVYGFVFFRDGGWSSVVIDDKLYLRKADYEDSDETERSLWEDNRVRINSEEEYRKEFQSNSRALYYAQSSHPDETWVPLIEKAFAKAHGDYSAIESGQVGEGIEDLTGGMSTTIASTDILSKDKFWQDLLKVNEEFLFGCGTIEWYDPQHQGRDGIHGGHAYSILKAKNYENERLLMVKNPWGQGEWNGPWSDGSSQWNAESIKALGHTFGDDGVFWIRFSDLLKKYDTIWRTRLFSPEWNVTQQWTSLAVPWSGEYQDTKFEVVLAKAAHTVIALGQLNDRYFKGFEGQYSVQLSFRLHKKGEEEYVMRTDGEYYGQRSVSVELDLEAGVYEVRLKLSAWRNSSAAKVEDVVKSNWLTRREKLISIGLSYDLAHAKGQLDDEDKEAPASKGKEDTPAASQDTKPTEALPVRSKAVEQLEPVTNAKNAAFGAAPEGYDGGNEYNAGEGDYDADADKDKPADDAAKEDDKPAGDPWGAATVVGLRVYCKGADATIQIVRPKAEVKLEEKPKLDIDDPAKDASMDTSEVVNTPKTESVESGKAEETKVEGEGEKDV